MSSFSDPRVQEFVLSLFSGLGDLLSNLVAAVLAVVGVACVASVLGMARRPRDEWRVHRPICLAALVLPMLAASPLTAQSSSSQNVPTVEPRFTRILGNDSIRVNADALNLMDDRSVAVSPDGRWIAWTGMREGVSEIWVASTTGSEPVLVSRSGHDFAGNPVWFPDSRRLAFRSGSASFGPFIHSVDLDPQTGHPIGPLRQVSIEAPRQYGFGVSPDGSQIAYVAPPVEGRRTLRVVPAHGGTARTLWETQAPVWWPVWSSDGESVYVITGAPGAFREVRRVPVEGGPGEVAAQWEDGLLYALSPDGRFVTRRVTSPAGETLWELATVDGRALARFGLPQHMAPAGFWPGQPTIVAATGDVAAPLQVLPVSGGPARQVTETRAYDRPLRWMANGREVLIETQLDGETVYMLMAVDGGTSRQIRLPEPKWRRVMPSISEDGRHVGWATGGADEDPVLKLFDVEDGSVRLVTTTPCRLNQVWPGWDGGRFLYCEVIGDRHEFRAVTPGERSELLLAYPADAESWPGIGVRGDRMAFTENDGENGSLLVATAGGDDARRLVTLPGSLQGPVWSPDRRAIVVGYARPGAEDVEALVVRLTADGRVEGEPTILELEGGPLWWWDPQWLPDGSGFVAAGMGGTTALHTGIWLVSVDSEVNPVELTADEPNPLSYSFALSPDGRRIAYSSERPGGSSFWKVELGDSIKR